MDYLALIQQAMTGGSQQQPWWLPRRDGQRAGMPFGGMGGFQPDIGRGNFGQMPQMPGRGMAGGPALGAMGGMQGGFNPMQQTPEQMMRSAPTGPPVGPGGPNAQPFNPMAGPGGGMRAGPFNPFGQ